MTADISKSGFDKISKHGQLEIQVNKSVAGFRLIHANPQVSFRICTTVSYLK